MIGGLGVQELLIVFFIALILFGGKRLPEIGQSLGKAFRGFKDSSEKALDELHRENKAGADSADENSEKPEATSEKPEESEPSTDAESEPSEDPVTEEKVEA